MHFELTLSSTPGHAAPLASLVKQRSYGEVAAVAAAAAAAAAAESSFW